MHKSAIITIGNEILLGKTLNTNLAWLAGELALLGLPVEFSLTVKDEPEAIRQALQQAWGSC
ncbi:MAG TPA: molybdopterin-binding protein, partial [Candidatus Syntrophosphaera sp.]|nr:molybdopterin-binding protein [Candidatus Syntrophosphaera sp.]